MLGIMTKQSANWNMLKCLCHLTETINCNLELKTLVEDRRYIHTHTYMYTSTYTYTQYIYLCVNRYLKFQFRFHYFYIQATQMNFYWNSIMYHTYRKSTRKKKKNTVQRIQIKEVVEIAKIVPVGIDFWASLRSPDLFEPAIIPGEKKKKVTKTWNINFI